MDIKLGMDSAQLAADIRTAKDSVRTFTSEIRKSDAEMKAFGKSSDTLASKKKSLTSQFEAQEKQMELLNKAYDEQVKKSGENSKGALKLQRDINNLGGDMAKTQGEIDKVNNELDVFTESSDGAGDSAVDLYNNIAKTNDELKTSEANLKSADSAVKLYGSTTDTLKDKLGALGSVQEAQKSKMEALTAAYDKEVAKSGESSEAAQKLAQEMGNLQSSMNTTQGEIDKTTNELSELSAEAPNTAENVDQIRDSLQGLVMEKVIEYLTRIGDKLIELGKVAIETSAGLQAQAQLWEQVFATTDDATGAVTSYSAEAKEALKGVSDETGVMATAMEEGFIKANQQFLSIGTSAEDSLSQASNLMLYSADAAAAYNVELDAAQGSLQSFVKGNNSAGEAVGIFAKESQMLGFAVSQGYIDMSAEQEQFAIDSTINVAKAQQNYDKVAANSKSTATDIADAQNKLNKAITDQEEGLSANQSAWTNLDEATKQAVRVEYIENAYEMGKVLGTAASEAEEWENVNRNLEESQKQLNAALGEAAIELLLPIVKQLTDFIMLLTESFKNLSPGMKKVITIAAMVVIGLAKITPIIMSVINVISMMKLAGAGAMAPMILSALATIAPFVAIGVAIAAIIAIFLKWDEIMAWGKQSWPGVFEPLEKALDSVVDIVGSSFNFVKDSIVGLFSGVGDFWPIIKSTIGDILGKLKGLVESFLTPILNFIVENQELIKSAFEQVWTFIMFLVRTVMDILGPIIATAWLGITYIISNALDAISTVVGYVMNVILGIIKLVMQIITGDWTGAWQTIKDVVYNFLMAIWATIEGVLNIIVAVIIGILTVIAGIFMGIFNGIATFLTGIWSVIGSGVTTAWNAIQNTVVNVVTAIKDGVVNGFNILKDKVSEIWTNIQTKTTEVWNKIKEIIGSVTGTVDSVIKSFQGLWDNVVTIFDGIKNKITDTWNNVKDKISSLNPFGAEHKIDVVYDDDPYTPHPANGPGLIPMPATGNMLGSALSAVSSSANSIRNGLNSTFNGLNDLYSLPDQKSSGSRGGSPSGGRDSHLELLTEILGALMELNGKEDVIVMDKEVVARKLHKPLQRIQNITESRGSRLRGEINY